MKTEPCIGKWKFEILSLDISPNIYALITFVVADK